MFTFESHNARVHSVSRDESAATILIAEDDRRVRDSLDRYLRLEGYEVVAVPDGAAALKAHDAHRPDLLVLDVSMPHADGLSVCRMLRERGCETQILMLTAALADVDAELNELTDLVAELVDLAAEVRADEEPWPLWPVCAHRTGGEASWGPQPLARRPQRAQRPRPSTAR